jgi:hypothetical protein
MKYLNIIINLFTLAGWVGFLTTSFLPFMVIGMFGLGWRIGIEIILLQKG